MYKQLYAILTFYFKKIGIILNKSRLRRLLVSHPDLQDGWNTLFQNISVVLSIEGYHFTFSSEQEKDPYNIQLYAIYQKRNIRKSFVFNERW